MENTHERYERCFISTVFEHASKKFKTHIQFARELWPGKGDANVSTRIRAIRDCNSRGKPQGLKMSDAISRQRPSSVHVDIFWRFYFGGSRN